MASLIGISMGTTAQYLSRITIPSMMLSSVATTPCEHYVTIRHIRTDGGSGFTSKVVAELVQMLDGTHSITAADSHEENSIVERDSQELNR